MNLRKICLWLMGTGLVCATTFIVVYYATRPARVEMHEGIYPCIIYYRRTHSLPRPLVVHIVSVDLTCDNIEVLITPPDRKGRGADLPLNARTTSQFAREFGVQVAINGDGFTPWWSNSPWDYYPHTGDPVKPNGFSASAQKQIGNEGGKFPTLYINRRGAASFKKPPRGIYSAISGSTWLIKNGVVEENLVGAEVAPRTAVGIDGSGNHLILIVVDGRQPFYSDGATIAELAELMALYGGENAILLDGGGSSTMVIDWPGKGLQVINSPIDLYLPGRERPVANHLGIIVR